MFACQSSEYKNDKFQLQSSNSDGVCISSLEMNGKQILVGKQNNQKTFWLDGDQNRCQTDSMITSQITIQNGQILSSKCKGIISFDVDEGVIIIKKE